MTYFSFSIYYSFNSIKVLEYDLDYTDDNCISTTGSNVTCADVLKNNNYTGASCICTKTITLDKPFTVSKVCLFTKKISFCGFISG